MNYSATITDNALQFSSLKGTPGVVLKVHTTYDLEREEPVEKDFYATLWLTENAKERTVKTLREIGYLGNSFAELNEPILVGMEVEVSTQYEDNGQGQSVERVAFVNAKGSYANRGIKPANQDQVNHVMRNFDALLRNNPARPANGTAQATAPAPTTGTARRSGNVPSGNPSYAPNRNANATRPAKAPAQGSPEYDDLPF